MVIEADQWLLCGRGRERWPGGTGKLLSSDRDVRYHDGEDGFVGVSLGQNWSTRTFQIHVVYCLSTMPQ